MVYVHLATGFEEVEALTVVDVLRRAGIEVRTVSVTGEEVVTGSHDISVKADLFFEDADYDSCEMIMLPGGMLGATNLAAHDGLMEQIKKFANSGKKLAAICAAPLVLAEAGVLSGSDATIYPGMEDRLGGGRPTGEDVTVCDNIITGRGPALAMKFALTLVDILKETDTCSKVAKGLLYR